jgi:quinol monooxygenase YgiN
MSVVVVATAIPNPEHRAEVIAAFERAVAAVHHEPGCELYALHVGSDRVVMVEKWSSQEELDTHGSGAALKELGSALAGKLVAAPDVQVLEPRPAGTPEQGVL